MSRFDKFDMDGFDKRKNMAQTPQFTITKWNGVALWSWEMEQDTCAICKYVLFLFYL